jgi:hypothetical protein
VADALDDACLSDIATPRNTFERHANGLKPRRSVVRNSLADVSVQAAAKFLKIRRRQSTGSVPARRVSRSAIVDEKGVFPLVPTVPPAISSEEHFHTSDGDHAVPSAKSHDNAGQSVTSERTSSQLDKCIHEDGSGTHMKIRKPSIVRAGSFMRNYRNQGTIKQLPTEKLPDISSRKPLNELMREEKTRRGTGDNDGSLISPRSYFDAVVQSYSNKPNQLILRERRTAE